MGNFFLPEKIKYDLFMLFSNIFLNLLNAFFLTFMKQFGVNKFLEKGAIIGMFRFACFTESFSGNINATMKMI